MPASSPLPRATFRELVARAVVASAKLRVTPADLSWAASVLTDSERTLWARLSPYEQDHAVQVARRVQRRLAPTPHGGDDRWIAAALLHDIGKLEADPSLLERAAATLASRLVSVARARRWTVSAKGVRRRVGTYLLHGEIGARMIRDAGGREDVARWAEIHQGYRDVGSSGLPADVVEALVASDVA
jgi:HD domain